jgi:hypothetical protein
MTATLGINGQKFHYTVEKHKEGLIGRCQELKAVGVYGRTLTEVKSELDKAIRGYIETFAQVEPATA